MADPFKPSQVALFAPTPLTATMGRTEREFAAACLVRVCQVDGDRWQPVSLDAFHRVMKAEIEHDALFAKMLGNPFLRPDFHDLAAKGYARWLAEPGKSPIELTDVGIEAMRRWVRPEGSDAR